MDIPLGSVVIALAGRDKDKYFIVTSMLDECFVFIADGRTRKVSTPKKKKIKHLKFIEAPDSIILESLKKNNLTNSMLRKTLSSFSLS